MINDPLLPKSPEAHREPNVKSPQKKVNGPKSKRRSPARSAKILTVGLSTTAMLGMTTGYAFADLAQKKHVGTSVDPILTSMTQSTSAELSGQVNAQTAPTPQPAPKASASTKAVQTPLQTATPQAAATQNAAPQPAATQEVVIDVPVATPGNGNSSWKNQKSSGSN